MSNLWGNLEKDEIRENAYFFISIIFCFCVLFLNSSLSCSDKQRAQESFLSWRNEWQEDVSLRVEAGVSLWKSK